MALDSAAQLIDPGGGGAVLSFFHFFRVCHAFRDGKRDDEL
jgi:hypothetical protein